METEEDAKDTIIELRTKKRTFRGQSIKARLKTETVVKSFYPLQATPAVAPVIFPASLPYQPYMAGGMSADGFMPYMGMPGMMPMEAMMGQMAVDPLTGQPVPGMPVPVPVLQGEVVAADGRKMKGDGKGSGEKNRKVN